MDQQVLQMEVLRLLIPADWQFQSQVQWPAAIATPRVDVYYVAAGPGGRQLACYPNGYYLYLNDPAWLQQQPEGSMHMDWTVQPPMDAVTFLKRLHIPTALRGAENLAVVAESPLHASLTQHEQMFAQRSGTQMTASAGRVRVRYVLAGQAWEESVYAVTKASSTYTQGMQGTIVSTPWYSLDVCSVRAPQGQLDASMKTFQVMLHSTQPNRQWTAAAERYVQQTIAKIHRKQVATDREIEQMIASTWEQREAAADRFASSFSDAMLNLANFRDPETGEAVKLPTDSGYVFTDGGGNYVVSDDPNFNPATLEGGNWRGMEMQEVARAGTRSQGTGQQQTWPPTGTAPGAPGQQQPWPPTDTAPGAPGQQQPWPPTGTAPGAPGQQQPWPPTDMPPQEPPLEPPLATGNITGYWQANAQNEYGEPLRLTVAFYPNGQFEYSEQSFDDAGGTFGQYQVQGNRILLSDEYGDSESYQFQIKGDALLVQMPEYGGTVRFARMQ